MYWFKCCRCTVSSIFPVQSKNNILFLLRVTHNAFFFKLGFTPCKAEQPLRGMELQEKKHKKDYRMHLRVLPVFLVFVPALPKTLANSEQKNILQTIKQLIQLFVPIKRNLFRSLLLQNKSQRRGVLQGLLDKYSLLFIAYH